MVKVRIWDTACNCYYYPEKDSFVKVYPNGSVSIHGLWSTSEIIIEKYTDKDDLYENDIVECQVLGQYQIKWFKSAFWCVNLEDDSKMFLLGLTKDVKKVDNIHNMEDDNDGA